MRKKNSALAEKTQKTKALVLSVVLHFILFSGIALFSGVDKDAFIPDQLKEYFAKDKEEKPVKKS